MQLNFDGQKTAKVITWLAVAASWAILVGLAWRFVTKTVGPNGGFVVITVPAAQLAQPSLTPAQPGPSPGPSHTPK